ncbi:heme-binding protein 2-like [Penaeus japonicus]|uniref:heme-binding protein 2-like n=1 Tax=Penaeus japonicus TaxID=27405 RepID=UPI001C70B9C6|nr:heme-binding protein 2-like [Penaeus japonicus]
MKRFIACLAVLAFSAAFELDTEAEEIAPYTVIKDAGTYEIRVYESAKWVCHDEMRKKPKMYTSFMKLFGYITGENEMGYTINMTAPVTMMEDRVDAVTNRYQMCFYIPAAHQMEPPMPTEPGVYIETRPRLTVATRTFGGWVTKMRGWLVHKKALEADLKAAGEQGVDYSRFYGAGYDSPMKYDNRRNEVWFVVNQ